MSASSSRSSFKDLDGPERLKMASCSPRGAIFVEEQDECYREGCQYLSRDRLESVSLSSYCKLRTTMSFRLA
jgi:hypothetical protein